MKTGLFFGSFNPIHTGHLIIANHLLQSTDLKELWFVISPHNPLKEKNSLLAEHHRMALVKLAIDDQPNMRAEDIEFHMPQPSYTIDTLVRLKEKHPNREFALIMGEDNIKSLHKWKNYEQLLEKHHIYVYPRQGSSLEENELISHKNIEICENVPMLHLSASYIRNLIRDKKSIQYLVPDSVRNYIEEMHFYR